MNLRSKLFFVAPALLLAMVSIHFSGCGVYSFTGASTAAESITIDEFFNNTDLAPANLAQSFTNSLMDYYQRNSSLKVLKDDGQLHVEGLISEYRVSPIAPVSSGTSRGIDAAALTRLTISVRVSYEDTVEPKNSFKDKSFSFYADFPNTQDLSTVQEDLEKKIFDQILLDIFNATVANW
jgi:hypothetical protein